VRAALHYGAALQDDDFVAVARFVLSRCATSARRQPPAAQVVIYQLFGLGSSALVASSKTSSRGLITSARAQFQALALATR